MYNELGLARTVIMHRMYDYILGGFRAKSTVYGYTGFWPTLV